MTAARPQLVSDSEACVDAVVARVGRDIKLGLPLGLGKPLRFVNALYQRAKTDPSLKLHILTGLSLQVPRGSSSMERRFLEPFTRRLYGEIPELAYVRDAAKGKLPKNVKVSEFFFQAGSFLNNAQQQRDYIYTNYTHAVRDLMAQGINVIAQMVTPVTQDKGSSGQPTVSLSCNPDLTLDLIPLLREQEKEGSAVAVVAEINNELPWMGNHAAVTTDSFDVVFEHHASDYPLFSVPQSAVSPQDHLIGFYASTLLRDGGTLQVGIGSLGTALIHSVILRHKNNASWRELYDELSIAQRFSVAREYGGIDPFCEGLYGCSEMMIDGFIHLMEAGVLTREVHDDVTLQEALNNAGPASEQTGGKAHSEGVVMHGGFYLGPNDFYEKLRQLPSTQRRKICMTSVNYINNLFDHRFGDQRLKAAQRIHGRFINSTMMQTLNGAAVSDGLDDGRVVSGVGGQYNFVAMAHELPGARSILTLRSTRQSGSETVSNIVFNYANCTIPRHLRDIVITEYGIADLRGQPEEEVYQQLIRIADARFQQELLKQAKEAGKIAQDFELPTRWQQNTPDKVTALIQKSGRAQLFPAFPFSCDFTDEELILGKALKHLKATTATRTGMMSTVLRAVLSPGTYEGHQPLLERMGLDAPKGFSERIEQRLLIHALNETK